MRALAASGSPLSVYRVCWLDEEPRAFGLATFGVVRTITGNWCQPRAALVPAACYGF